MKATTKKPAKIILPVVNILSAISKDINYLGLYYKCTVNFVFLAKVLI